MKKWLRHFFIWYKVLREAIAKVGGKYPFEINAFVLLTDRNESLHLELKKVRYISLCDSFSVNQGKNP